MDKDARVTELENRIKRAIKIMRDDAILPDQTKRIAD